MIYLYLDESGDLGFDFENKRPSPFFTITVVVVKNIASNQKLKKEVEIVLKRKLNPKKKQKRIITELKWAKTTLEIKKYFFERIKDEDFDIYSITFAKQKVNENLRHKPDRLYNYFVKQLIDRIDFTLIDGGLTIVLDKSKNKEQIKDCNDYIVKNIEGRIPLEVEVNIIHEDSASIKQLQIADMFCYGFYEKYNKSEYHWYDVFKEKIRVDESWFG